MSIYTTAIVIHLKGKGAGGKRERERKKETEKEVESEGGREGDYVRTHPFGKHSRSFTYRRRQSSYPAWRNALLLRAFVFTYLATVR